MYTYITTCTMHTYMTTCTMYTYTHTRNIILKASIGAKEPSECGQTLHTHTHTHLS